MPLARSSQAAAPPPHETVAAQASPGEADAALLKVAAAAAFRNLPPTDEFVVNGRGERLQVRSTWPPRGSPVRGVVLALHGYGAHCGRPPFAVFAEAAATAGFAFVSFDFHGHGHSTGPRAFIADPSHLVDDVLEALLALYAGGGGGGASSVARSAAGLPLFLFGHSMGGGVALLVGSILTHGADAPASRTSRTWARAAGVLGARVAPAFTGAFLLCPFVTSDASWAARTLLVGPLAAMMPTGTVPAWLVDDASAAAQIWASPAYRRFTQADGDAASGGLSYSGNICFRTLATILALGDAVCASLPGISFPFAVLHDPADAFVPVAGSRRLLAEAPATSKAFVATPGGLHDIAANQPRAVTRALLDWLQAHAQRTPVHGSHRRRRASLKRRASD